MKIRMVFTPVYHALDNEGLPCFPANQHGLLLSHIVDDAATNVDKTFEGCWLADGDVEALELDVLPPLDKVTLTIQPTRDEPLPEPLYRAGDAEAPYYSLWPVLIRSVSKRQENGLISMTMGGPVAYTDSQAQAETLAGILNAAMKPDPNEPV